VLINFASATYLAVKKPIIQSIILNRFGYYEALDRESEMGGFGWTLFDYVDYTYNTTNIGSINIVNFIISSNFGYEGFTQQFEVLPDNVDL
jgi:hypothetical protein